MELGCLNFSNMMMLWLYTVLKNTKLSAMQRQLKIYYNTSFILLYNLQRKKFLIASDYLLGTKVDSKIIKNMNY